MFERVFCSVCIFLFKRKKKEKKFKRWQTDEKNRNPKLQQNMNAFAFLLVAENFDNEDLKNWNLNFNTVTSTKVRSFTAE